MVPNYFFLTCKKLTKILWKTLVLAYLHLYSSQDLWEVLKDLNLFVYWKVFLIFISSLLIWIMSSKKLIYSIHFLNNIFLYLIALKGLNLFIKNILTCNFLYFLMIFKVIQYNMFFYFHTKFYIECSKLLSIITMN